MPDAPDLSGRRRALYLGAAVALLLALVIPVALLSGGSQEGGAAGTTSAQPGVVSAGRVSGPSLEGRLVVVETDRLVINTFEPIEGQGQFELAVRPVDAAALNIDHLSLHSSQGLPSRIFYEQEGSTRYAVGQQDSETAPRP